VYIHRYTHICKYENICMYIREYIYFYVMMMIAFITFKSSLVPLFEGL